MLVQLVPVQVLCLGVAFCLGTWIQRVHKKLAIITSSGIYRRVVLLMVPRTHQKQSRKTDRTAIRTGCELKPSGASAASSYTFLGACGLVSGLRLGFRV